MVTSEIIAEVGAWVIQPSVIFSYVGLLLLVFFWNAARFSLQARSVTRGLAHGNTALSSIANEEAFAQAFPEVDERLQENGLLREAWGEFKETLIFPESSGDVIRNSRDAGDHFTTTSIIERDLNIRYYNSVPNILTGLGILGTFVGLAGGIAVAQASLGAGDLEEIQRALSGLLGGAALAFVTSIAGIFLSLLFLGYERRRLSGLQRRLASFVRSLDNGLRRVTPEAVLTSQLGQLREQTGQLKRFNTDLAFSIAEALDSKIGERLSPALDRLINAVHELREQQDASNEESIRQLVEEFRKSMGRATGAEFENISRTLNQLDQALSRSVEQMSRREAALDEKLDALVSSLRASLNTGSQHLEDGIRRGMDQFLEGIRAAVGELQASSSAERERAAAQLEEGLARVLEGMERGAHGSAQSLRAAADGVSQEFRGAAAEMSRELTEASESIGVQVGKLKDHVDGVQTLASTVKGASGELSEAMRGSAQLIERFGSLEAVLREAAARIADGGRASEEAVQELQASVRRVEQVLTELGAAQERTSEAWQDYRKRFEGLDDSLKAVFQEIDGGVERYTRTVGEFNREMDHNLSKAVESLGGAVNELHELVEELGDQRP